MNAVASTEDWLDTEPTATTSPASGATAAADDDSWLKIEDPNAGRTDAKFRALIDACMRGTNRVMACDGHYLAYRPFNREFDKEVNPRAAERFNDFRAQGFYKHLGTYDEVQIYELEEGSPFRHSRHDYVIGRNYWADVRTCARAACAREWSDYHDLMGAVAATIKAGAPRGDQAFGAQQWQDFMDHVRITIEQMKGPTIQEVDAGFQRIRQKRGISKANPVALAAATEKFSTRGGAA